MEIEDNLYQIFYYADTFLLTPFRTQNVPPPMCSTILNLSPSIPTPAKTPVHAAFSPAHDQLGVVWENGFVELFELHTRTGPGSGNAINPTKIFSGLVCGAENGTWACRQIMLSRCQEEKGTRVVVLAWGEEGDVLSVLVAHPSGVAERKLWFALPRRDGRLVQADDVVVLQGPEGDIYLCESLVEVLFNSFYDGYSSGYGCS